MKYFHMGMFVILGVCLIRKYGSQTTAFFLYSVLLGVPCLMVKQGRKCSIPKSQLYIQIASKLCIKRTSYNLSNLYKAL